MLKNNLIKFISPIIQLLGYEFIGIEFLRHSTSTLRVYINHEHGINIKDCIKVSRKISHVLDIKNLINVDYVLEVSSPGINNHLYDIKNFMNFIGYEVKLVLYNPIHDCFTWQGVISSVSDKMLNVITDNKNHISFTLKNIKQSNLVPHFTNIICEADLG